MGDIPVPLGCGGLGGEGGLQGFSPGLGSAAYSGAEFVDIPVPGRGGWGGSRGGLQGACPGQGSTVRTVEQVVLHGAPPDFHQVPLLSAGSSGLLDLANHGDFRTFSRPGKSAKLGPHSGSEMSADFTPSTPAAYVDSDGPLTWVDDAGNTWWQSASGRWSG